jgi:hypothetical protein
LGLVFLIGLRARAEESRALAPPSPELVALRAELDATFGRMQATSRQVRELLRDARKRGTTRQVQCVDEALSRADTAFRAAREAGAVAASAYERGDDDAGWAMRVRVRELAAAARLAAREGSVCAPASERVITGTVVRVIVDPRIARPASP